MPYALYLYIIPQCSRSLPQTYSVSSHAKKTFFPPSLPSSVSTRLHAVSGCPGSLSSPLKCHANFRGPRCMGPLSIPLTSVLTGITGRVVACFKVPVCSQGWPELETCGPLLIAANLWWAVPLPDLASAPPGKEEGREEELFEMLQFHEELRSRTESKASDIGKGRKKKYRIKTCWWGKKGRLRRKKKAPHPHTHAHTRSHMLCEQRTNLRLWRKLLYLFLPQRPSHETGSLKRNDASAAPVKGTVTSNPAVHTPLTSNS